MVRTRLGAAVALGVMFTGVGCRAADEPATQLRGTTWRVETTRGCEVIDSAASTITSKADGRVHGRGGCNCYFGTSTIDGDQMSFSALGSTKMACADALMDQETRFFRALASAERWTIDEDRLLLIYSAGADQPSRFAPSDFEGDRSP